MVEKLIRLLLDGDRRALARVLTHIENGGGIAKEITTKIFSYTGNSQIIGITGPPGTGKSTLVNELIDRIRAENKAVAILAIDPSSPISGGAIMGDRVRMLAHTGDPGVYIRSMASRGKLGGLANAAREAIRALDTAGFPVILLETVGAGQSEVDVAKLAHTTIVVEAPGLGDDIQAFKAGLLEIADILVVNKADRPGATQTVRNLHQMLDIGHHIMKKEWVGHHQNEMTEINQSVEVEDEVTLWTPPIVKTVATRGEGINELWSSVQLHLEYLQDSHQLVDWKRTQLANELCERVEKALIHQFWSQLDKDRYNQVLMQLEEQMIDPYSAVEFLLSGLMTDQMNQEAMELNKEGDRAL